MKTGRDWRFRPHHGLERSRTSHPPEQILPGDGSERERKRRGGRARRRHGFAAARRRLGRKVTTARPPSRRSLSLEVGEQRSSCSGDSIYATPSA
ncbi:hypothetical protein C2845_PM07G09050 [Panicum miliaceum]|uniref:Uncharacterized protein n=1 Tax=Panicum miliaceum TaxID=4540 RepID=A0A3L6SLH3_PANMI|nr:hypothetical protein C2845_PM07G09050 [Panicum miliaceum]